MTNPYVGPAIVAVTLVTVGIGFYGLKLARTTSDFLVASRMVSPTWNAAAIGGEYLSAASFLGVAGLILKYGVEMIWYPVGFAAGYLALLLFVAAPLRRSGAFTLPDFCQVRLGSPRLRKLATAFVVFIGWLYLVPQLQGAGLTLTTVTGQPYALGALLVGVVVTANVALGGMRAITFVQAFQYWLKLTALAVPAIFLILHWQADGRPAVTPPDGPVFRVATTVVIEEPATLTLADGSTMDVKVGEQLSFDAGEPVPVVSTVDAEHGPDWLLPGDAGGDRGLFATYSLILATFLGTMGLPHVLVRFYTNPDGGAARRTTLVVLCLVGDVLPATHAVRGAGADLHARAADDRPDRRRRAAAARGGARRRPHRAVAGRARGGRRVRRVPVQLVGAADQRRRRHLDGCDRARLGARLPARDDHGRAWCRSCWRSTSPVSTCRRSWGWRSRSRRRASARCSCWASGGGG